MELFFQFCHLNEIYCQKIKSCCCIMNQPLKFWRWVLWNFFPFMFRSVFFSCHFFQLFYLALKGSFSMTWYWQQSLRAHIVQQTNKNSKENHVTCGVAYAKSHWLDDNVANLIGWSTSREFYEPIRALYMQNHVIAFKGHWNITLSAKGVTFSVCFR